ncbi:MAG: hypothetical protein BWY04_00997 [candidate division CPR1 bacterium ADurb.Bin160]|uniref:Uncharacterized protein n=1 Tax=candidate division CPR1 bacterium ADurb.Bin160 TaxID=1852826 RepID=A0A1V5ZLQ2_9BACT|nr:MAG: hypothetical protein BWY04_00997 [candidate division CPR1 bacterium ADurb.Bin160]
MSIKIKNILRSTKNPIFTKFQKGQKSFLARFKNVGIAVQKNRFTVLKQNLILLLTISLRSQI